MNKLFAMLLAVMFMLGVAAVTVFAESTENLVEDYEIVEEDTEIVDDEVEAPKPAVTVANPAESAPTKTETVPKKENKKPVETRPAVPSVTTVKEEDEISEPQIIPEDTEGEWSIDLGGMEDFFSDIPFGDIFGSFTADPAPETGEPLDEEGNAYTRDLQYDKDCHKQFITVQTRGGNMFYIIIDYDSPINAEEEQYQAYFLNMVDDADLLALLDEETAAEMTTCTCKDKCVLGKVNADCPVCKNDLTGCKGIEPEPPKVEEPPAEETPTEEPKPTKKNNMLPIIGVIGVVAIGGLTFYYIKFIKGKKKDDMDFYDDEGYEEHYVNEDEDTDSGGDDEEDLAKVDEEE